MASAQFVIVDVSPEMTTVVGCGEVAASALPEGAAQLRLYLGTSPRLAIRALAQHPLEQAGRTLTLFVQRSALKRLFDWTPRADDDDDFHLPHDLAAIAERIWQEGRSPEVTHTYRLAKSIELLCELVEAVRQGTLMPFHECGSLSAGDTRRLLAAKRMIDEEWSSKLTLGAIAQRCGLNRTKLARGFRALYHCSVREALVDRRLDAARLQLLSTDLPIGVIGYRSGYLNNAAFTRAFGRRFGVAPSDFRMAQVQSA
ncbi:MAG: AraC family transcriptional regulator [Sphingomonadales bacterium]|nr:AraC family transcriptional regulator [Sphingomonadales bacterium]